MAAIETDEAAARTLGFHLSIFDRALTQKLPEDISSQFDTTDGLLEELNVLIRTQKEISLPTVQQRIYTTRIKDLLKQLGYFYKLTQILKKGYEPYHLPDNYYVGGVDSFIGGLRFNVPIPGNIIAKYLEARDQKLFDTILVGAPDWQQFEVQEQPKLRPRSLFCEPVMVGYTRRIYDQPLETCGKQGQKLYTFFRSDYSSYNVFMQDQTHPGVYILNGEGFLIAYWDVAKDREKAGLT